MTMNDIEKSCHCKYAKCGKSNSESTTAWIECRLKNSVTDISHCAKCKEREEREDGKGKESNELMKGENDVS